MGRLALLTLEVQLLKRGLQTGCKLSVAPDKISQLIACSVVLIETHY
jgi:hypothetical protein